jgi:hypothetical protein
MATGLMALIDDCIKERWQTKKVHHIPVPLTQKTVDVVPKSPRSFLQQVFGRRNSKQSQPDSSSYFSHKPSSPLRYRKAISTY